MDNILNTITAYRKERNWSLYDLAAHAELKPSTISTWYNAMPFKSHFLSFLLRQREVNLPRHQFEYQ